MPEKRAKRFVFGWHGDRGLGERLIQEVLSGRKTATSCPAYDPEDADVAAGDWLDLTDKDGRSRALLQVTAVEIRDYGSFDEALASREGATLAELAEGIRFANSRVPAANEPMRVIYFKLLERRG